MSAPVGQKRPRPVVNAATVGSVLVAASLIAGWLGYANVQSKIDGASQAIISLVLLIVPAIGHLGSALYSQRKVTPLSSPQDVDGVKLERKPADAPVAAIPTVNEPSAPSSPGQAERIDMIPDPVDTGA